jgi:hypothetical protein
MALSSCKEEEIGQYPVDKIAPKPVNVTGVENLKGGVTVFYEFPDDNDFLYVKAIYKLPNGQEKYMSSTENYLTIKGFARSTQTEIQLISVDRSRNESNPVSVTIEPLDSPIFDVYASLQIDPAFGGIKMSWENEINEDVVIGVLTKSNDVVYESLDNFYSSVSSGNGTIRGLAAENTDFGFYVRDIYGNSTDTLFLMLTPLEEVALDKKLWTEMPLCSSFAISSGAGWSGAMSKLWDGATVAGLGQIYYLDHTATGTGVPIFFAFDLGVSCKLSRFTFWGRDQWYFNLHHPKEIEIWGTNDINVARGDACSWDGWELLLSCSSTKPSGDEPIANADLSNEDKALAAAGEEFEFPADVPVARYIRFRCLRTWTDSQNLFLGELSFWGSLGN